jgi:hypothetical protein
MSITAARSAKQTKSAAAKKAQLRSTTAAPQYQPDGSDSTSEPAEQQARKLLTPKPPPAPSAAAPPPTSQQRQGDRGSSEDAAASRLPHYVRFHDLRAAGIVSNWPQLYNLINDYGFPAGVMLSPNIRAWNVDVVRAWLDGRPTERKKVAAPNRSKETAEEAA